MTIRNKKLPLAFFIGLIFANTNALGACTSIPDCGALGYTMTAADCSGQASVKCPFNSSKMLCAKTERVANVGDILYGDGSTSASLVSGKKAIGVVFDAQNRLALALTDVKQNGSAGSEAMGWATNHCDIIFMENCENNETTSCGIDGRANTDEILASVCLGTTFAASAVDNYQSSNCTASFCQKGLWFLPSLKDLNTIYGAKSKINSTLSSLSSQGATKLLDDGYWSSTEHSYPYVWFIDMKNGELLFNEKIYFIMYARPAIKY